MSQHEFPARLRIVQAPMAGVQDSALAIAVSAAGGVGSLPCAMLSPDALKGELDAITAAGCRHYNLNFFCHRQPEQDAAQETRWRNALAPYFREYGIDPQKIVDTPGRLPFTAATLDLIRPYHPPIVSFHFGLPDRQSVDEIKSWGGMVWSSATTLEEAMWLEAHGADAVIAQGVEAGGHRGMFLTRELSTQTATMTLLAKVTQAVKVPIIAAGGIAGPEQVKRAIDHGAWAVQVGTAYLCCTEARTSTLHRELLSNKQAPATQITNLLSGRPARGLPNRLMKELGPINDIAPEFPRAASALTPLRAAAEAKGRTDFSPLWCGTDTSGCRAEDAAVQTEWLSQHLRSPATP